MSKVLIAAVLILVSIVSCMGRTSEKNTQVPGENNQPAYKVYASAMDSLIFLNLIDVVSRQELTKSDCIIETAKFFLETPYVASTLEIDGDEQLVVNLRQMDCTTFVEYVLALSISLTSGKTDFDGFVQSLGKLRYRNGEINGYPSRLHYFTDWLQDNHRKGIITIISNQIGDTQMDTNVDFMTTQTHLYKQLSNQLYFDKISAIEKNISTYEMKYIAKSNIDKVDHLIENGDVIALVTSIAGLDVSHVGLAIKQNGYLHFIHASTSDNKVVITNTPLSSYLLGYKRITGILVARIK